MGLGELYNAGAGSGLLSALKLTPKFLSDEVYWDDLDGPNYKVLLNKPLSEFYFKRKSNAFVKIKKDYLDAYVAMRKKSAVQVFCIIKDLFMDSDIELLLRDKQHYIEEFKQYNFQLSKSLADKNMCRLEINGYKVIAEHIENIEESSSKIHGHYWKGIEGLVTEWRARHELPGEVVYVSDKVLAKYEDDDDYEINPETGYVSYKNKWSISHSERVGRNAVKIELKKLYEGNNDEVISYWNQFSIAPSEINFPEENIPQKARKLVEHYFRFGRSIARSLNSIDNFGFAATDVITLDEERINYTGWTEFSDYISVCNHVSAERFTREQFLSRCKKLNILLTENLKEAPLRRAVDSIGFPKDDTKKFKALKLLDLLISYFEMARESGLDISSDKDDIRERIAEKGSLGLLTPLFALNDIRQLDAHKNNDIKQKLNTALKSFGIHPNGISNNYADAMGIIFDQITKAFEQVNSRF